MVCVCRMRTVSESSLRRTHADQISVSSSGSSNADMEDLSTPQPLKLNFRVSNTPSRVFQRCPSPPGLSPLLSTVSLGLSAQRWGGFLPRAPSLSWPLQQQVQLLAAGPLLFSAPDP